VAGRCAGAQQWRAVRNRRKRKVAKPGSEGDAARTGAVAERSEGKPAVTGNRAWNRGSERQAVVAAQCVHKPRGR